MNVGDYFEKLCLAVSFRHFISAKKQISLKRNLLNVLQKIGIDESESFS